VTVAHQRLDVPQTKALSRQAGGEVVTEVLEPVRDCGSLAQRLDDAPDGEAGADALAGLRQREVVGARAGEHCGHDVVEVLAELPRERDQGPALGNRPRESTTFDRSARWSVESRSGLASKAKAAPRSTSLRSTRPARSNGKR
jgi:hypothetical protein